MTDAPTLIVNATDHVHPEDVDAFRTLAPRMAVVGSKHDGCVFLTAAQDTAERRRGSHGARAPQHGC